MMNVVSGSISYDDIYESENHISILAINTFNLALLSPEVTETL